MPNDKIYVILEQMIFPSNHRSGINEVLNNTMYYVPLSEHRELKMQLWAATNDSV